MERIKQSFSFAASGTTLSRPVCVSGIMTHYTLVCPNFTNAVTTTLSVEDSDGVTIWTGNANNESGTYLVSGLSVPVDYGFTLTATLSGAAGAGGGMVVAAMFVDTRN